MADPPPKVQIRRATENGIEYMVRYRIMPSEVSPAKARHTINESVIRALRDAGIELAYPRRRILEESTPNLNA
jgi:small-conductance mechanosensitive channel